MVSRRALITPLLFMVVSLLWIFLSDMLVKLIAADDKTLLGQLQTAKGSLYVILASAFIYVSNRLLYKSLEERDEERDLFYSNSEIAFVKYSIENRIIHASRNIEHLIGYTASELKGKPVKELTPEQFYEEDQRFAEQLFNGDLITYTREKSYIHKKGHLVPMRLTGSVKRDSKGNVEYFMVAVQDMTNILNEKQKRQIADERLSRIISLAPGAFFKYTVDAHGEVKMEFISEGIRNLTGFEPSYYMTDFSTALKRLSFGEDHKWLKPLTDRNIPQVLDTEYEFRVEHKNGSFVWVRQKTVSVPDKESGSVHKYGIMIDVTNEKAAEQELERLAYDLSERVKELKFINYVSSLLQVTTISPDKVLSKIVRELPNAFRFPEKVKAIIKFRGRKYESDQRVGSSEIELTIPLATNYAKEGEIKVCACDLLPDEEFHDFFLSEEKDVLNALAEMLRNWLEKQHAEVKLRQTLDGLERMVEERTKELREAHNDITSSIDYAQRIQQTILPTAAEFKRIFPDSFVFFRPKDVVSGDFYWLKEHRGLVFIACVDCTGHGVPGAMLSIIGNQLLESLVVEHEIDRPNEILEEMHKAIVRLFTREGVQQKIADGMDLSLCIIDRNKGHLSFSGAHNNAYLFRDDEVVTMKADRHSLGGVFADHFIEFEYQSVDYRPGDILYMNTDGFIDQFGGPDNRKFYRKNLISLYADIKHLSLDKQGAEIESTFMQWMGDNAQMDDVTVVGIRL